VSFGTPLMHHKNIMLKAAVNALLIVDMLLIYELAAEQIKQFTKNV